MSEPLTVKAFRDLVKRVSDEPYAPPQYWRLVAPEYLGRTTYLDESFDSAAFIKRCNAEMRLKLDRLRAAFLN